MIIEKSTAPQLRVGAGLRLIEIVSGPHVVATKRGYQPVLIVKDVHEAQDYMLYISATSLTEALEEIRKESGVGLEGVAITIRKESEDPRSQYVVSRA